MKNTNSTIDYDSKNNNSSHVPLVICQFTIQPLEFSNSVFSANELYSCLSQSNLLVLSCGYVLHGVLMSLSHTTPLNEILGASDSANHSTYLLHNLVYYF